MTHNLILKLLVTVAIGSTLFILSFSLYFSHKFYSSIFRLSSDQIQNSLFGNNSQCQKLRDCTLLSGDVLVRRYITSRTWIFDTLAV